MLRGALIFFVAVVSLRVRDLTSYTVVVMSLLFVSLSRRAKKYIFYLWCYCFSIARKNILYFCGMVSSPTVGGYKGAATDQCLMAAQFNILESG